MVNNNVAMLDENSTCEQRSATSRTNRSPILHASNETKAVETGQSFLRRLCDRDTSILVITKGKIEVLCIDNQHTRSRDKCISYLETLCRGTLEEVIKSTLQ